MAMRSRSDLPTVTREDFMTQQEAADALHRRSPGGLAVGLLVAQRILIPVRLADSGEEGVTRRSVAAELAWRASASRGQKLRRVLGHFVRWI
jgi:hypothetical protein